MTRISRASALLAFIALVAGCQGLSAVSRSTPHREAMRALDACGITTFDPGLPAVRADLGIDVVDRMGLVIPGRDANRYAPLGNAREIKTDVPVWVIVTRGWIELPLTPGRLLDATCVVVAGGWEEPNWFATGGRESDVTFMTPFPQASPDLVLPTLAP